MASTLNGQHNVIGYIQIAGIPGESTDQTHTNWIEIRSLPQHEMKQIATVTKSSGGPSFAGTQHSDFQFTAWMDASYPKLAAAVSSGQSISTAEVDLVRADGGNKLVYCKYTFSDFMVSGVQVEHANATEEGTGSTEVFPTMTVSLNYTQVQVVYTKQGRNGSASGNVTTTINLAKGTVS
jgi:type VI secretion system secreted protein Hcp